MSEQSCNGEEGAEERPMMEGEDCVHYSRRALSDPDFDGVAPETPVDFQKEVQLLETGLHHPLVLPEPEDAGPDTENLYEVQLQAAKKLRQLLSSNRELLIQIALERNWVPLLLKWLMLYRRPQVQVEALWALTNIAAGTSEHTQVLVRHGAIPILVSLLTSENEEVLEQSVWVLGNLAGEGPATRDTVLAAGVLRPLVSCLERYWDSLSLMKIGSWALSNFCDGQPRPAIDISIIINMLARLLYTNDFEVLSHTCWALSHLCDGPSAHIKAVIEANVCSRLVALLGHKSWRVTKPALRTVGNIVCAEDDTDYTQYIIDAGAVPHLRQLIAHCNREIQKEACWTLSNIAAGTMDQIQQVLDCDAIPYLVQLARSPDTDPEVKSEACWVVLNATSCGSDQQIDYLVQKGCVSVLGDLLSESSMVMMALEGLERILQVGEFEAKRAAGANPYAALMSTARIEELEGHKSSAVAKRASRIWRQYFITCAICGVPYPKNSPEAFFCAECKCHVCRNCDCTVFHLSYQVELWNEMSMKEASAHQAQKESKKQKKQKKKQKEKERKKATAHQKSGRKDVTCSSGSTTESSPSTSGDHSNSCNGSHEERSDASDDMDQPSSAGNRSGARKHPQPPLVNPSPTSVDKLGERGVHYQGATDSPDRNNSNPRGRRKGQNVSKDVPPAPLNVNFTQSEEVYPTGVSRTRKLRKAPADDFQMKSNQTTGNMFPGDDTFASFNSAARMFDNGVDTVAVLLGDGAQEGKAEPQPTLSVCRGDSKQGAMLDNLQLTKSHSGIGHSASEEAFLDENDELVDFLEETGSILALAAKLDLVYEG